MKSVHIRIDGVQLVFWDCDIEVYTLQQFVYVNILIKNKPLNCRILTSLCSEIVTVKIICNKVKRIQLLLLMFYQRRQIF